MTQALIDMLLPLKPIAKTITRDNGKEFAYHKKEEKVAQTKRTKKKFTNLDKA